MRKQIHVWSGCVCPFCPFCLIADDLIDRAIAGRDDAAACGFDYRTSYTPDVDRLDLARAAQHLPTPNALAPFHTHSALRRDPS